VRSRVPTIVLVALAAAALCACSSPGRAATVRSTRASAHPTPAGASHRETTKPAAPSGTPTAHHFGGSPTVGALFPPGLSIHVCTASVVDSRSGDLLLTAAHCIVGTGKGYVFAPGYHDGVEPYGAWTVTAAYGPPAWISRQAPDADYAFLVVAPRLIDGHSESIEDATGANRIGVAPRPGSRVTVPAYVLGSHDDPITCTAPTYDHSGAPAFNCNLYADGTSGAPWLERTGHSWEVVGVIGGLHQGGCYPWTSYTAPFDASTQRLAVQAASGQAASTFPTPGGDGCPNGS
jgi:hypothetical protein